MQRTVLYAVVILIATVRCEEPQTHPLSDEFIELINNKTTTWTAGRNFPSTTPLRHIKKLLGVLPKKNRIDKLSLQIHRDDILSIPDSFDSRRHWPRCASIIEDIRDQAACGSCWAFASTEAMSDRICIHSSGRVKVSVSAEDVMDCCLECGDGCDGGYPDEAWYYWGTTGIVTGGGYKSHRGCKSYSFEPCDLYSISDRPDCQDVQETPACIRKCDPGSGLSYGQDLTFGKSYRIWRSELQIQLEILQNGPVGAAFDVYEDFFLYRKGIYQYVGGRFVGGHAVKILGWGHEGGVPYWLVANSWNTDWGEDGYFKILRGADECGIESDVLAGLPVFK